MDNDKVALVASWPQHRSARGFRGFLGLAGYYRKFIQGFGTITAPLTQLLKKNSFQWTEDASSAFLSLNHALSSAPVLHLTDFQ
jgi:hypothetical protein